MTWLNEADCSNNPDRDIRHLRIRGLRQEEYEKVRKALSDLGLADVMVLEPECFPSSGIWYVRYYRSGSARTLVAKRLKDLPKAIRAASIHPMGEFITRVISKFWERPDVKTTGYSPSQLGQHIAEELTKRIQVEAEEDFSRSLKGITNERNDAEHQPPDL